MDNVKIVGLGKKRYTGRPECAQERDLEGAAHPGPWPGSVEAASRQGKRAGWICEGRLAGGALELGSALRWAELDLTDPVNAVVEHSSSRASSKQSTTRQRLQAS